MLFADRQIIVRPKYPCCGGEARFRVIVNYTGIQRFWRKCPRCGFKWLITRKELKSSHVQVDRLEWEAEEGTLYQDIEMFKKQKARL